MRPFELEFDVIAKPCYAQREFSQRLAVEQRATLGRFLSSLLLTGSRETIEQTATSRLT